VPAPDTSIDADWGGWERTLEQFSASTSLVVSAYDLEGRRRIGPFLPSRRAQLLGASTLWAEDGPGTELERALVGRAAREGQASEIFCDELQVLAAPLALFGTVYGVVVYGWTFRRFTSGMACERIARRLGAPGASLWAEARLESPVSDTRMATYSGLLATLIDSATRQKEAIARLNELNRMREVFLAAVSHEMRTPLSAISLRLDVLLLGKLDDPERLRAELTRMKHHVGQETRMVEDLIDAAQTRTGNMTMALADVSLRQVLRDALSTVEPLAASRGIVLALPELDSGQVRVLGDAQRLQQLFWNLLSNAVKFTPPGGTIALAIRPGPRAHEIDVADSGQGIDADFLPEVFGAFNKDGTNNADGLGLGLYIARHIAELHGGAIGVASAGRGRGTTFTVTLPNHLLPDDQP
jgi:signal transduction histidine kinase